MKQMTGNVILTEVDALMYVMLSRGENNVPYGELVGTTEPSFSTNLVC